MTAGAQTKLLAVPGRYSTEIAAIPRDVACRAVHWLVQLQSDESTSDTWEELQRWRQQHPDHERAWLHIEMVNAGLQELSAVGRAVTRATLNQSEGVSRRQVMKTLGLVVIAGATLTVVQDRSWQRVFAERTGAGEQRTLTLPDGWLLSLNSRTAVRIDYGNQRRIRLLDGEILLAPGSSGVATLSMQPLTVETWTGHLTTVDGRFCVRALQDSCLLSVFEGAVQVQPRDRLIAGPMINADEEIEFNRDRILSNGSANAAAVAWTRGLLVASGMRLQDFLTELARHRRGYLHCDPAIADLLVSGTYPLANTNEVLRALARSLSLELRFLTPYWASLTPA